MNDWGKMWYNVYKIGDENVCDLFLLYYLQFSQRLLQSSQKWELTE